MGKRSGYGATGPGGVHVNTRLTLDTLGNLGLGVSSPVTRLQVNSLSGQNPFRADIAGTTRFQVNSNGGTAIGSGITPPVNGLRVSGIIEPVGGISYSGDLNLASSTNTAINANGSITIDANGAMDVLSGNTMDIQNSAGTMNVKNLGGNMNVQATSTLNLDGGVVDINNGSQGAARTLDAVGGGIIVSGSSTVKIGN